MWGCVSVRVCEGEIVWEGVSVGCMRLWGCVCEHVYENVWVCEGVRVCVDVLGVRVWVCVGVCGGVRVCGCVRCEGV